MKKIMTIVGTRPEIIKLSRVIAELEKFTDHVLVHTGQNYDYELNEIFFDQMEIRKPDIFLQASAENPATTIGNIIARTDAILVEVKPDAVLLYGDTNSCLAVISAKRRKIPIFHMEAGNRCFDQRVPEEINRKIVDHLSDVNMTLTEHARRYLINEGVSPETIFNVGSSMKEVLTYYYKNIASSKILEVLSLEHGNFFVVSMHREENIDSSTNFQFLLDSLNAIAESHGKRVLVSTHPRTRKKIEKIEHFKFNPLIEFIKPLGFFDYICLQKSAACTISDSGTITEESSILGFPAVTIRDAHERPEGMDEGTLIMSGVKREDILNAIHIVTKQWAKNKNAIRIVKDYDVNNVSLKVVRIIISYLEYVNKTVWKMVK